MIGAIVARMIEIEIPQSKIVIEKRGLWQIDVAIYTDFEIIHCWTGLLIENVYDQINLFKDKTQLIVELNKLRSENNDFMSYSCGNLLAL